MSVIGRKLKSKAGISMAIALVFLLLCAMVGTVVLAAASVNAGKLSRERQYYRQTLALTSAADVITREVKGLTFVGAHTMTETVITTVTVNGEDTSTKVETKDPVYQGKDPALTGAKLLHGLRERLGALYVTQQPSSLFGGSVGGGDMALTFRANGEKGIPEVAGTLTLLSDYSIQVVLRSGQNSMTLIYPAQASDSVTAGKPTITSSEDQKQTVKTTVTEFTTKVTWGAPTLKEGGAA